MIGVYLLVGAVTLIALGFAVQSRLIQSRRRQWLELRLTESQRIELGSDFIIFTKLPESLRNELEGLMHVFIYEKSFEACGGIEEVTDHMQRVIAAQACLLLLNRKHDYYRKLRSVLVYPSAYKVRDEHGEESVRLGESWNSGSVILAWKSVVSGGRNDDDGHDVSIHEFSHQLDQVDGAADGVPELESRGAYREWSRVFSAAFGKFQKKLEKRKRSAIDPYGGTNPAEFFAVSTETFYEKPRQLKREFPEVYAKLCSYYKVDPLEWE
ncbi:MAG: zinc-dependent peptidase [Akkermansiaceae bacterium]